MSYAGRMYFRMALPGLLAFVGGVAGAAMVKAAQEVPGDFGGLSVYSNVPLWIFYSGVGLAVAIGAAQIVRIKLWERGAIGGCYVCGCLLGAQSTRRGLGMTRKCLGCGKVHGMNHRLAPVVIPLAVAVQDTARAQVRSVRSLP